MFRDKKLKLSLDYLDQASKEFDLKKRYVIRGKKCTQFENVSYGATLSPHESELVFLYEDYNQIKHEFDELIESWKNNTGKDVSYMFEIHEVTKDELYSIYKKARII